MHSVTYAYEPNRNLMTIVDNQVGASSVSKYTYRYDGVGRRIDRVDEGSAFTQPAFFDWDYDGKGQVTAADRFLGTDPATPGASVPSQNAEFAYDEIGNRLTSTFGTEAQRTYTTNALNRYTTLTTPPLTTSPLHDLDGNLTYNGNGWWYEWNGENRMVEARDFADPLNPPSSATRLSFTYDYQGRRVEKKVESFNGSLWSTDSHQRFVYEGWNLIATFDASSSPLGLQSTYLWGLDLSGSMQGAGGVGGLLSATKHQEPGTPTFYPTYDANGNVSEYLDESGAIEAHYEYSPFGRVIASTGTADAFAFRFSTKYTDNETGLLYYGFRYYDPQTGRWLSRDPIGEQGGLNLYGFVGNEPVGRWDLLGMAPNDPSDPTKKNDSFPSMPEVHRRGLDTLELCLSLRFREDCLRCRKYAVGLFVADLGRAFWRDTRWCAIAYKVPWAVAACVAEMGVLKTYIGISYGRFSKSVKEQCNQKCPRAE